MGLPDGQRAALRNLYGLAMREAEVMLLDDMFHLLGLIFLAGLLLVPLLKRGATVS